MREAADSSDEFAAAQDSSSDDEELVEGAMQLGNVVTAHKSESGRQGEAHAHSSAPHAGGDDVVQVCWVGQCLGIAAAGVHWCRRRRRRRRCLRGAASSKCDFR